MEHLNLSPQIFKVSDFVTWQRTDQLQLSPSFQRRPTWPSDAKSYFLDSVIRGFPVPLIFLRERVALSAVEFIREVVDGQQRLRTLFAYIDAKLLKDFDPLRDPFTIRSNHNQTYADKSFTQLPPEVQRRITGYQFSVLVLPPTVEDRDILQMFARLNSTGQTLNRQELRNAAWFGLFKTCAYALSYEQLDRWRRWSVFSEDQIARMLEVEMTSDLMANIISGLSGKSQPKLDAVYKTYDKTFPDGKVVADRFRRVMDAIDELMGPVLPRSVFRSQVYFFTLFVFIYDLMYGIGSPLDERKATKIPPSMRDRLLEISGSFQSGNVPEHVLDAVRRASADLGRRRTRLDYMRDSWLQSRRRS